MYFPSSSTSLLGSYEAREFGSGQQSILSYMRGSYPPHGLYGKSLSCSLTTLLAYFYLDNHGDALREEQIRIILGIAELPKDAWVLFSRVIT